MTEITEEILEGEECACCGDDMCCTGCSFIDTDGKLCPLCHDCGEQINYPEEEWEGEK